MFQLLRSSLVNNKTQATVCEELGIPEFVINDSPFDTRHTSLRVKQKADLLEGKYCCRSLIRVLPFYEIKFLTFMFISIVKVFPVFFYFCIRM